MTNFEQYTELDMYLEVTKSDGTKMSCSGASNCSIKYTWQYTPIIYHMVPAIVYPGMTVAVRLNPAKAPMYKREGEYMVDLRIDGTSLDLSQWYNYNNTLS